MPEVDSKICLFADYTTIYYPARSKDEAFTRLSQDLINVQSWFELNHLEIHYNKSKVMCVLNHAASHNCSYEIRRNNFDLVTSFSLLGLTVVNQLRFDHHISNICSRINSQSYLLAKNSSFFPLKFKAYFF